MADTLEEITSRLHDFIREEGQEAARARSDVGPIANGAAGQTRVDVGPRRPPPSECDQIRKFERMKDTYEWCLRKLTADERVTLDSIIRELFDALPNPPGTITAP